MDERIRFVIRLKDGESMAALCREFQISRKTGYKIFDRYEECGLEGLTESVPSTASSSAATFAPLPALPKLHNSGKCDDGQISSEYPRAPRCKCSFATKRA